MENLNFLGNKPFQVDIQENTPEESKFPIHIHNHFEVLFFIDGEVDYSIRSNTFRLQDGTLLLISPRSYHSAKILSQKVYKRIIFSFTDKAISEELWQFAMQAHSTYLISRNHPIYALIQLLQDVKNAFTKTDFQNYGLHILNNILLFLKYYPDDASLIPIQKNQKLRPILHYINQHPLEPYSVNSLSSQFFVSPSWLTHTFHDDLGISLNQFIIKNRILYAQTEISAGTLPSEIALKCGYDSYSTFYLQYKKVLGHSPKNDYKTAQMQDSNP